MIYSNIKMLDNIYSHEHGRGTIINIKWRREDQLFMCYFPSIKGHLFILSREIKDGRYSLTELKIKKEDMKKNVKKSSRGFFDYEE